MDRWIKSETEAMWYCSSRCSSEQGQRERLENQLPLKFFLFNHIINMCILKSVNQVSVRTELSVHSLYRKQAIYVKMYSIVAVHIQMCPVAPRWKNQEQYSSNIQLKMHKTRICSNSEVTGLSTNNYTERQSKTVCEQCCQLQLQQLQFLLASGRNNSPLFNFKKSFLVGVFWKRCITVCECHSNKQHPEPKILHHLTFSHWFNTKFFCFWMA